MRCPKCGFISFDHLDNCLKCNKELKSHAGTVQGTVFNVQAPTFLKIQTEREKKSFGDIEIDSELESGEFDLQDPDLEILLDEEEGEEEARGKATPLQLDKEEELEISPGESFELSLDTAKEEEEEGITIDLGQFQNDLDEGKAGLGGIFGGRKEDGKISLDFPDELSDISDLSPPHQKPPPPPVQKPAGKAEPSGDFDFSLDLDLNGLAERPAAAQPGKAAKEAKEIKATRTESKVASLSLDDIDLSPAVKPGGSPRKGPVDAMNMDEELNFDLDLGGLSIHKEDKG